MVARDDNFGRFSLVYMQKNFHFGKGYDIIPKEYLRRLSLERVTSCRQAFGRCSYMVCLIGKGIRSIKLTGSYSHVATF